VSRVTGAILHAIGQSYNIASTPEQYVRIAQKTGDNLQLLRYWRMNGRKTALQSPLCNEAAYVEAFAKSVIDMTKTLW
jgi:predicted O-linked N-acetylglucosamine transferase (SPINDLY family)